MKPPDEALVNLQSLCHGRGRKTGSSVTMPVAGCPLTPCQPFSEKRKVVTTKYKSYLLVYNEVFQWQTSHACKLSPAVLSGGSGGTRMTPSLTNVTPQHYSPSQRTYCAPSQDSWWEQGHGWTCVCPLPFFSLFFFFSSSPLEAVILLQGCPCNMAAAA